MKFIKLFLYALIFGVAVYFHTNLFRFLLEIKLSYTFSMIIPYAVEFLFACLVTYEIFRLFLKNRVHWIKRIGILGSFSTLAGIAFSANIIYDSDFSNEYNVITVSGESQTVFQDGLTMVALPGCPYCHERLGFMKYLQSIYPELKMHVLVVNHDLPTEDVEIAIENNTSLFVNALSYEDTVRITDSVYESYQKNTLRLQTEDDSLALANYITSANEHISVNLFPKKLITNSAMNPGRYPTFFYKMSKTELYRWTNDGIGSAAWDFIIKEGTAK